jgi:hypothetical protein
MRRSGKSRIDAVPPGRHPPAVATVATLDRMIS